MLTHSLALCNPVVIVQKKQICTLSLTRLLVIRSFSLRLVGVSYSNPTNSSISSGSETRGNPACVWAWSGLHAALQGESADRRVKMVAEADRAGSCCTPLCGRLQPQRTVSAAAAALTPNHNSFTVCEHADLGSAHKDTQSLFAFNWLNKGTSPLTCALRVYGDKSLKKKLVFFCNYY